MYALTIKQPWADAIVHGTKRVENRIWPAPRKAVGSSLLIHAGKSYDPMGRFHIDRDALKGWPDVRGAVLAIAILAGCHLDTGCCRPWGDPDSWHWRLADIQPLHQPVSCPGALRLWTPSPTLHHTLLTNPTYRFAA